MNLSCVTARVGKRRGRLPALSPKSYMTPKGSLRRGGSAGMEKREHRYHTKKTPHPPQNIERGP